MHVHHGRAYYRELYISVVVYCIYVALSIYVYTYMRAS